MANIRDWFGPRPKEHRKTDRYMPWDAFPETTRYIEKSVTYWQRKSRVKEARPERKVSTGERAFQLALTAAWNGEKDAAEISHLRGTLRKSVVTLAEEVAEARRRSGQREEQDAKVSFIEAVSRFTIVCEKEHCVSVWRARLPLKGEPVFADQVRSLFG